MPLRDASRGTEADAGKIVHLVTGEDGDESVVDAGPGSDPVDEPPRPPVGGGVRPSLKRVK
jgi:stringent starvation protein B